ncbi:SCO6881 family protein [Streptomyces buecherae]|uniref:SCO6881 family protein n=1 Tax=Streptomyces buecherae TaxID=2763006 RepID=UPI0027E22825|nr:ATP-binding protein [Streptomyces buecherae]
MGFCDIPLADKLCDAGDKVKQAGEFAANPGKAIGDWLAKSAGELAAAAADLAAKAVDRTTKVDLRAHWFVDNYQMLLPIGLTLLVATFCAQLIRAAIRRDGQALAQAFTGTASGVLFAFAAIALTTVAIEVTDALSAGLFQASNQSLESAVRRTVRVADIGTVSGLGWLVAVFAGVGAAVGAFLFWCVMMVRKVGILVLVTLAVFAGAGGGWEVARRWRRGWIEATATLIVSKLLMTVIFVLGIAAMGQSDADDGLSALADVMSGIVILAMVLLCPYATFKFVHWAAEGTSGEDIHRAGGTGAQVFRQHAERAGRKGAAMMASGGAAAAAPQGPTTVPGQESGFPGDIASHPTSEPGKASQPHSTERSAVAPDKAMPPPAPPTGDSARACCESAGYSHSLMTATSTVAS